MAFVAFHVAFVPRTWTASSFPLPLEMTQPQRLGMTTWLESCKEIGR